MHRWNCAFIKRLAQSDQLPSSSTTLCVTSHRLLADNRQWVAFATPKRSRDTRMQLSFIQVIGVSARAVQTDNADVVRYKVQPLERLT